MEPVLDHIIHFLRDGISNFLLMAFFDRCILRHMYGLLLQINIMLGGVVNFFRNIWKLQVARYRKKGLKNFLIALFLGYLYAWWFPIWAKSIWPENVEDKLTPVMTIIYPFFPISLLLSFLYLPIYSSENFKQYDINPTLKKQWQQEGWPALKKKTLIYNIINYFMIIPGYFALGLYLFGTRLRYEGFPSHAEIFKTFLFVIVVDDFLFMLMHRIFHIIPFLYRFHKLHHEYKVVASFAALYSHPIETIFANLLPGSIVFLSLDVHFFTFIFFSIFKIALSQESHSDCYFPWSPLRILPLFYDGNYHSFHHSVNTGNYATAFYVTEMLFGTNKQFLDSELAKIDAAEKIEAKVQ